VSIYPLTHEGGHGPSVRSSNLLVRTASAIVLLGIALAAAFQGGVAAGVVAAAFALVIVLEWSAITGGALGPCAPFAISVAVAVVMASLGMVATACFIALLVAVIAAAYTRQLWLPAGVIYASVFGISLMAIRIQPEFGLAGMVFLLAVVWATDSGAFFVGRTVGGPKLAPRLSPKKTWAGAIGGLVAALLAGLAVARLTAVPVTFGVIAVAFVLSVFCQLGDLFESWLKRRFGVKESGNIIPGHGGVMDRVDGLALAGAVAVAIGAFHEAPDNLARGLLIW
jgi:phosphatidate cytidylyltransferase